MPYFYMPIFAIWRDVERLFFTGVPSTSLWAKRALGASCGSVALKIWYGFCVLAREVLFNVLLRLLGSIEPHHIVEAVGVIHVFIYEVPFGSERHHDVIEALVHFHHSICLLYQNMSFPASVIKKETPLFTQRRSSYIKSLFMICRKSVVKRDIF